MSELTQEDKDKLAHDWSEFKKLYGGKSDAAKNLYDYLMFLSGWMAHRNGGVR